MAVNSMKPLGYGVLSALLLVGAVPGRAAAQGNHDHGQPMLPRPLTLEEKVQQSALTAGVRAATARFRDPAVAQAEGYGLLFGCVSGTTPPAPWGCTSSTRRSSSTADSWT